MSLADNNFESDLLEVDDCLLALPAPLLYEQPASDDRSTSFSKKCSAIRRPRSTVARYSAYKLPSREQRHALIRNSCRKEMFVTGLDDAFIPPTEPTTIHPMANLALPIVQVDMAAPHAELERSHIHYDAQPKGDLTIRIPSAVDRLGLQLMDSCIVSEQTEDKENEDVVDYAAQNGGLTIKIPGLVDRLALRLLGSCSVTEEGEDEDNSSLDESITSETSSSDDGIDDHHASSYSSSLVPTAAGPDRTSLRKNRRIAAPYHRAERKPRRKELWVDTDNIAGREVPVFLLGSPASVLCPDRHS